MTVQLRYNTCSSGALDPLDDKIKNTETALQLGDL